MSNSNNNSNKNPLQDSTNLLSSIGSNIIQGWSGFQKQITRQQEPEENTNSNNKNNNVVKVEETLICPITHELPYVPVMAEDGHIYERSAIEEYFFRKNEDKVLSPMTGVYMGKTLISSPQSRNTIEALIENGVVTGDLAEAWKKKKEEKRAEDLLKKADHQGDVYAMLEVAYNYCEGQNGFPVNHGAAFTWFERAHFAGSVVGLAEIGAMLVLGIGAPKNEPKGLVYLGIAAGKGSDFASYALGLYFIDGKHGLPVDKKKGIELLEDSLNEEKCPHACMKDEAKFHAKALLKKLANTNSAT